MISEHSSGKLIDDSSEDAVSIRPPYQCTHASEADADKQDPRSNNMHRDIRLHSLISRQFVIVSLIIGIAAILTTFFIHTEPVVPAITAIPPPPKVLIVQATPTTTEIPVESYGVTQERTRLPLHTEVTGKVTWVAPNLQLGQTIEIGEPLVRIDATEFNLLRIQAEAEITAAKLQLSKIEAQAKLQLAQWQKGTDQKPTAFVRMEPELASARTHLTTAQTQYQLANLNIERSVIRAPFSGRVRATHVEPNLYVTSGSLLAEVYKTDYARVRFPLNRNQLSLLRLTQTQNDSDLKRIIKIFPQPEQPGCSWDGEFIAMEGEVDPKTQTIFGIADIPSPYAPTTQNCLPLISGSFVRILIFAPAQKNTYHITSRVLRDDKHVYIVDDDDRLVKREVQIIYEDTESAVIGSGITPQMRIVVTMPDQMVAGMRVTPVLADPQQTN